MTSVALADHHVHSTNSGDARHSIRAMCNRAVELGLTEIAFTEHVDFEPTDHCYRSFDCGRYMTEVAAAREEFAGRLVIRVGVECDYQDKHREELERFLEGRRFDFVLGAAHYADGVILSEHSAYFSGKTEEQAYLAYFQVVRSAVRTGLFDAIAHLDLCKRYGTLYFGRFEPRRYSGQIKEILAEVVAAGMALEINTSGLRQAPGELYPGPEILVWYAELGGRRVTIGSDAHRVQDLGAGIAEAAEMASAVGLDGGVTWRTS